jgi:exodeoxyribonuclease VII small subunit
MQMATPKATGRHADVKDERGEVLKDHCDRLLKQAEAKVEKLTLGQSGQPTGTEPFRGE